MLLMLHYDVWQSAGGFDSLEKEITPNQMKNQILVNEILEVLEMIDKIGFKKSFNYLTNNH
jgi:hypothetical protein